MQKTAYISFPKTRFASAFPCWYCLPLKMNNFTETISYNSGYLSEVKKDPSKHLICKTIFIRNLSSWKGYIIQLSQLSPQLCLSCISYSEHFTHKILFSTSITS